MSISVRHALVIAALVAAVACKDSAALPPPVTVAGAWQGTAHVRADVFTMTLTQNGTTVTGSGTWRHTGITEPLTVAGTFESGLFFKATFTAPSAALVYDSGLIVATKDTLWGTVSGTGLSERILDLARQP